MVYKLRYLCYYFTYIFTDYMLIIKFEYIYITSYLQ